MSKKITETLYRFSMIYVEAESNLGLFYQEGHVKSFLDKEDCTSEDILERMIDEMKPVTLRVVDGRLMVVYETNRFVFSTDVEDGNRFNLAVVPADDEEQIPVAPNITEEAAFGRVPFWYDGSGYRKVSDFNDFVEVVDVDEEFFGEIKEMAKSKSFTFFPRYLCFDEEEIESKNIITQTTETKVAETKVVVKK